MAYEDKRDHDDMKKIFVGGLNRDTTDDAFRNHFSQYGEITDCIIIKEKEGGASKGFGFVTFTDVKSVEDSFAARPHTVDGKEVEVKRAMPKDDQSNTKNEKTKRVFIGGISEDDTPEEIKEYIMKKHGTEFGHVEEVDILKDNATQKNKKFGFINCSSEDFADRLAICERRCEGKSWNMQKAEPKDGAGRTRGGGRGRGGSRGRGGDRGGRGGYDRGGYNSYGGGAYNQYSGGYDSWGGGYDGYGAGQYGGYGAGYGAGGYGDGGYGGRGGGRGRGGQRY